MSRAEESMSELQDRTIEITQTKLQKLKKNEIKSITNMWANSISNPCVIRVSEGRERIKQKNY